MQNRLQQFHDVPVGAAGLVKLHAAAGGDVVNDHAVTNGINVHTLTPPKASE